jgi:hypothetical protein
MLIESEQGAEREGIAPRKQDPATLASIRPTAAQE